MGRELRKVPADWQHPRDESGKYIPLYDGKDYQSRLDEFIKKMNSEGMQEALDWCGNPPNLDNYTPNWPEEERTHFMMYENTSEGTPISTAFATPEELARWLADTGASAFGHMTADYEHWLAIARGGWATSLIVGNGRIESGVQAVKVCELRTG